MEIMTFPVKVILYSGFSLLPKHCWSEWHCITGAKKGLSVSEEEKQSMAFPEKKKMRLTYKFMFLYFWSQLCIDFPL